MDQSRTSHDKIMFHIRKVRTSVGFIPDLAEKQIWANLVFRFLLSHDRSRHIKKKKIIIIIIIVRGGKILNSGPY